MEKKIISSILILVMFIFTSTSYAKSSTLGREDLQNGLEKMKKSDSISINDLEFKDDVIKMTNKGENFEIKCDFTGSKPKFNLTIPIDKGISYKEYEKKTGNSIYLSIIPYVAIASSKGIEVENSLIYIIEDIMNKMDVKEKTFMIVSDDTIEYEGTDVYKESEFSNKVIDILKEKYKEKEIYNDSKKLNSYSLVIERKNTTNEHCDLSYTLTVDSGVSNIRNEAIKDIFSDITQDTADKVINLKVGQKCKFVSSKNVIGYGTNSNDKVEVEEKTYNMTAKKAGIVKGYIQLDGNEKKTVYIIIKENKENKDLDTITINLDENDKDSKNNSNNINEEKSNNIKVQNNNTNKIPQAGQFNNLVNILELIIILSVASIICIKLYTNKISK